MPELTEMQDQIVKKSREDVEALLGKPVKVSYWTNARPPEGADANAVAAYEAEALDEIWIYANGRVHFTMAGKAVKVDDEIDRDLPPPEGTVFV
jgi:hypothetical protein